MDKDCVAFVLGAELEALYFSSCPVSFEDAAGQTYEKKLHPSDDNGFYDWMRDIKKNVVGVRWMPLEDDTLSDPRVQHLKQFSYIVFDKKLTEMIIYFRGRLAIDEKNSCDQDFMENNLFVSEKGKFAVSFSIAGLNREERKCLPSESRSVG